MNLADARELLDMKAKAHAAGNTIETLRDLCEAASLYAKERTKASPKAQTKEATSLVMPFGKEKNIPISEAKTSNLQWMAGVIRESLDAPEKVRFRAQNSTLLEAIERELESR